MIWPFSLFGKAKKTQRPPDQEKEDIYDVEPTMLVRMILVAQPNVIFSRWSREDDHGNYGDLWFISDDSIRYQAFGMLSGWGADGMLDRLADFYELGSCREAQGQMFQPIIQHTLKGSTIS